MYTSEDLDVSVVPGLSSNLEFLPVSIKFLNHKFCICVFYRLPSSFSSIFDTFFQSLEVLDISPFCNFLCVGDFNVDFNNSSHPFYPKLCNIIHSFGLTQIVTGHTHVSPLGHTSLIDLVLVSSPDHVRDCSIIPPLANSDHLGLHISLQLKVPTLSKRSHSRSRTIWRYSHADFDLAQQLIAETNWDDLITDDIDSSWLNWQSKFLEIMETCIPHRVLPPRRRRNLPWLSKGLVQAMRRRNALFKRAKRSGSSLVYGKFCRARNKVVANLRNAKAVYFQNLKPTNAKHFWKAVNCLKKTSSSIPVLTHNNSTYESDQEKANVLNSFFASCFNNSVLPL